MIRTLFRNDHDHPARLVRPIVRPILLGVLAQACAIGLMAVSGWLLSRAAEHPPVLYLMTAIVAVRALGIGRGVLRYRERLAGHDVALGLQAGLRVRAYRRLAATPLPRRAGDLLSRLLADLDAVQDLVVRVLVPIASSAIVIIATGAVIATINLGAGIALLCGSFVSGAVLPWLAGRLAASAAVAQAPLRSRLAEDVREISLARLDLAAYQADARAGDRLAAVDRELAGAERRAAYAAGVVGGLQWLCTGTVIIASLLSGARAVAAGQLPPVFLAVLALTPLALHEVIGALPAAAVAWRRTRSALTRVAELIAAPAGQQVQPAHRGPVSAQPTAVVSAGEAPLISARGLAVGWPGAAPLLRGLDLEVRAGERVALVGPSGIGKSTVAAALLGAQAPLAGTVRVQGRIGYLAQDAHIFDTTVAENVRIGDRDASDDRVRAALAEVGLPDLPLQRRVGEYGGELSGGEGRRLALSRLVVGDSSVLILDEPTEHLDRATAAEISELIMTLRPGAAVLVITHDPELMARCDRVVELGQSAAARAA